MNEATVAKTRIIFLDHAPIIGGAQLALVDHVAHLDRTRFEPHIVLGAAVPEMAARYEALGVPVHRFDWPRLKHLSPARGLQLLRQARRLRALVRRLKADVVVANTSRTAYTAALGLMASRVPVIWWVRDFDFGRRLFGWASKRASALICVSNAIRDFYGCRNDSRAVVVYVASGIHKHLPAVSDADVATIRERWGFSPTNIVVGYMGRLVSGKGPQDVIEAAARLAPDFPSLRVLIAGTGKNQEGDIEEALIASVKERGLTGVVQFAGFQSDEALYYRMFDIFVLSSRYREAMPTSVIQAMMAGRAVVATSTGGTPEVVLDGQTGSLIPPADPSALTQALRRLLEDAAWRERLARAGHRHAMAHHREEVATARVEELYETISPRR